MQPPCESDSEPTITNPESLTSGGNGPHPSVIDAGAESGTQARAHAPTAGGSPLTFGQWWFSDWGPGPLIALALPLFISTGFTSIMLFTDRTLLFYWDKTNSASAAMGAGTFYWALMCLPTGMLSYLSAFVSQYIGAGRPERVVVAYRHALRLAWLMVPLLMIAFVLADFPFWFFEHNSTMQSLESTYLRTLIVGGIAVLFYSAQSGLMTGLGYTGWVLVVDAICTLINLVLTYILIFGFGPIPSLGVMGAGMATGIAFWLKLPIAAYIIRRQPALHRASRAEQPTPWEPAMLRRLIAYGAPAGLQMLAESAAFTVIMLQVGRLGGLPMTATTLALGLNVLAFVPMMGLGIGVGVLVGKHVLERRIDLAQRTVTCAIGLSVLYTGSCAILLGFFPEFVTRIYSIGSTERFEDIRPLLMPILQVIAVYCVLDGFQIVFVGAIKGAGDTWFVLGATAVVGFGMVGLGLLCEQLYGASLMLWWYIIAAWVFAMAIAFGWRYWQGKWKTMQVIEHTPVDPL
ncbi:MAG: MATE family efflux transporter [Pirellulaceae bacterium]|nr:MATE family efflux transporter [Pirellulaceae bacterium]